MHAFTRSMLVLALAAVAAPAPAEEFTLMIYETPADLALRTDAVAAGPAYWQAYAQYSEALKAAGVLRGGAALAGDEGVVAVTAAGEAPGAHARFGDGQQTQLGGYFVVDVADRDAAVAWARKAPALARGGAVEVRPAYPAPAMTR